MPKGQEPAGNEKQLEEDLEGVENFGLGWFKEKKGEAKKDPPCA